MVVEREEQIIGVGVVCVRSRIMCLLVTRVPFIKETRVHKFTKIVKKMNVPDINKRITAPAS